MPSLSELLARELELIRDFIGCLESEQETLKLGETESLDVNIIKKNRLVEQLNAVESERGAFLRRAGHAGDRNGMQTWLSQNPNDQRAAELWSKVIESATTARQLNDLNGQLIAMRLQATNQAIAILTHQPQRTSLYGRDGMAASGTGSRIIDAA